MGKHFEKLVQCDPRLYFLSQQAEIVLETPYFEPRTSVFDDSNESNHEFDSNSGEGQTFFELGDAASPSGGQSSSLKIEQDLVGRHPEQFSCDTPSPSSGIIMNSRVKSYFPCFSTSLLMFLPLQELLVNFIIVWLLLVF